MKKFCFINVLLSSLLLLSLGCNNAKEARQERI